MNHASPLFNLDDLATAEAAELVRRLQLARTSTASGYDRLWQDAEQVARKARHFSAELIRELISLGGGYELAANATLSATQADFMLGLLAASSHGELIRDALTIFVRRGPLEISDAVLYGLYDAAARLAEESRNRTMGAHYPKEIREILDAIADARMEKRGPEAERKAAPEVYRRQEADRTQPSDRAGSSATSSPYLTIDPGGERAAGAPGRPQGPERDHGDVPRLP